MSTIDGCKSEPKIIHLGFLDEVRNVYSISDTAKYNPLKDAVLYFLVNQNENKDQGDIRRFVIHDSLIQTGIKKNYYSLSIKFYKKSKCTEKLMKMKNIKQKTLCNDDLIVEYSWKNQMLDVFYYEKGRIKRSVNIQTNSY